jgi:hypothetical protein
VQGVREQAARGVEDGETGLVTGRFDAEHEHGRSGRAWKWVLFGGAANPCAPTCCVNAAIIGGLAPWSPDCYDGRLSQVHVNP